MFAQSSNLLLEDRTQASAAHTKNKLRKRRRSIVDEAVLVSRPVSAKQGLNLRDQQLSGVHTFASAKKHGENKHENPIEVTTGNRSAHERLNC
jgi:hypothetical protein